MIDLNTAACYCIDIEAQQTIEAHKQKEFKMEISTKDQSKLNSFAANFKKEISQVQKFEGGRYSIELKEAAAKLFLLDTLSVHKVAKMVGISGGLLGVWNNQINYGIKPNRTSKVEISIEILNSLENLTKRKINNLIAEDQKEKESAKKDKIKELREQIKLLSA